MKVYVLILILYLAFVQSIKIIRKPTLSDREVAIDDAELGDFQKLLNKFNLMSSSTSDTQLNFMPRMRFRETAQTMKDEGVSEDSNIKYSGGEDNFPTTGLKDHELKRIEGLSNGLILYNSKRTVNSETSDYSHLYFDLLETN